jgi:hypothetical protein
MSRKPLHPFEQRVKRYADPMTSGDAPHGSASSKDNLAEWSARATANSPIPPRATGPVHGGPPGTHGEDAPSLPSTKVTVRATSMAPKVSRKVDKLMEARGDLNHAGDSDYLRGIRRGG